MAEQRRRRTQEPGRRTAYRYEAQGSSALQPNRVPKEQPRREIPRTAPKRRSRTRSKAGALENLRVRPGEAIAPVSVIGMLAVAVLAVLILQFRVQLYSINSQVVSASNQLSELKATEDELEAQYEQLFDLQSIESDLVNSGKMLSADSSQQIYLELSEPDTATTFSSDENLLSRIWSKVTGLLDAFS